MIDFRPVLLIVGLMVAALGATMALPLIADLLAQDAAQRANWASFAMAGVLCLAVGGGAATANWGRIEILSPQQGFLLITLVWVGLGVFGGLPYMFGTLNLSFTDAVFESVSGFTTTGATVVSGLDDAPPGFLLWRALSHWFGGVGVIIMAISALPMLQVGGMQLFRLENSDTSDKILPRARQVASAVVVTYTTLTAMCFLSYWLLGMPAFDAVTNAMSTLATGGFSTKDASFGAFVTGPNGPALQIASAIFMLSAGIPFLRYVAIFRLGVRAAWNDAQLQFYLYTACMYIAIITLVLILTGRYAPFDAFIYSAFNVSSVMTGTGFATTDYGQWGSFAVGFFFILTLIGGCTGSSAGGVKIFRIQIVLSAINTYIRRLAHPHGVFPPRYNGRPLTNDVFVSVLSFFFIYFATFTTGAVIFAALGLDPLSALSAAAGCVANVGPGLGPVVGPAANYGSLPDTAKWTASVLMLLGRLEFLSVFVLFTPAFWRR